jgi:THO complex subunit 2
MRQEYALQVDKEREREKEKEKAIKEEDLAAASAASKRRRIKRDHLAGADLPPDFGMAPPPLLPGSAALYEGRDRDRKGGSGPTRSVVTIEDVGAYDSKGTSSGRIHAKENTKVARREQHEQTHEREWEDEKRQRGDLKPRRHHRK